MTDSQFTALASLLRLHAGPAQEAARLALVDGLSAPDAARSVGMSYIAAFKAIKRAQKGFELAQAVVDPHHWMRGDQWTKDEIEQFSKQNSQLAAFNVVRKG